MVGVVPGSGPGCSATFCPRSGVVQGMITGIRGLCNGLGPALYGFIFYIFHVELKELPMTGTDLGTHTSPQHHFEQVEWPSLQLGGTRF